VIGTYSSVYVSSSLLISLGLEPAKFGNRAQTARPEAERIGPRG
jgi:preprotein translocase subunit SecF